jgi:uncharacterized membrane protein
VLAGILLTATLLRLHRLGDELWLDEILTQIRVARLDLAGIATSYESQNQHLLYSLLARLAIVTLGDTPAALRVPALAFGVLSVLAVYLLGRELLSRREALLAAALLCVSDLHVWFSQNARGYSALLFATLLSSWLLLRALDGDRRRTWLAYALATTLGLWVHLTMLFVVAGHGLMVLRRRARASERPRRALWAGPLLGFGGAALLALAIYAPILPAVLAVTTVEGRQGWVPEWSSSSWAIGEVLRGLIGSFAHPQLALYAVVLGCVGAAHLLRRRPVLLELLVLPVAVGAVVVVGSGHHVWPRLFFFAIGFAALIVVHGAEVLGRWLARRAAAAWSTPIAVAPVVLLVVASAGALPDAYGPKQRHADALALVDAALRPGDVVATVGPAARVVREYHGRDWISVATAAELARVRAGARRTFVVTAFPIHLRGRRPEVARMLEDEFLLLESFPGTVHGADVLVWSSERPDPAAGFPQAPR